jgi:hypothetical protein
MKAKRHMESLGEHGFPSLAGSTPVGWQGLAYDRNQSAAAIARKGSRVRYWPFPVIRLSVSPHSETIAP